MTAESRAERVPEEIKRIIFAGENHFSGTVWGTKLNTLRVYRPEAHELTEGELFIGVFKEEGADDIELVLAATTDTDVKPFSQLSEDDLQNNGYEDINEAYEGMKDFYPNLTWETQMAVINYKVPEINGVPIIKYTQRN